MPSYFDTSNDSSFPESFEFPRSFEYSVAFGLVTLGDKKRKRIFEGSQQVIFDDSHNRVRTDREMRIFHEKDRQIKLYEFDRMRLLVSDPDKKACLKRRIVDTSPVSMIPHDKDQIVIADALQSLWIAPQTVDSQTLSDNYQFGKREAKTQYLGEHQIAIRSTLNTLIEIESFHLFTNNYSFLELEENYAKKGGTNGAQTIYLWRKIKPSEEEGEQDQNQKIVWQLAGFATRYRSNQPNVYGTLGNTFHTIDQATMDTNEFQLKFYQKEC